MPVPAQAWCVLPWFGGGFFYLEGKKTRAASFSRFFENLDHCIHPEQVLLLPPLSLVAACSLSTPQLTEEIETMVRDTKERTEHSEKQHALMTTTAGFFRSPFFFNGFFLLPLSHLLSHPRLFHLGNKYLQKKKLQTSSGSSPTSAPPSPRSTTRSSTRCSSGPCSRGSTASCSR